VGFGGSIFGGVSLECLFKSIETAFPKLPGPRGPRFHFRQGSRIQRVNPVLAIYANVDPSGLTQNLQVLRNRRGTHLKSRYNLPRRMLALRKHFDDASAGRIRNGSQHVHEVIMQPSLN
jgi:hypothetical protein